jgi:hypothetical protein
MLVQEFFENDLTLFALPAYFLAIARDVKRASRWLDRWRYLLLAPGWSHDGPDKRARTLRQASPDPL